MTTPGGIAIPVAGVIRVGALLTHRRRGPSPQRSGATLPTCIRAHWPRPRTGRSAAASAVRTLRRRERALPSFRLRVRETEPASDRAGRAALRPDGLVGTVPRLGWGSGTGLRGSAKEVYTSRRQPSAFVADVFAAVPQRVQCRCGKCALTVLRHRVSTSSARVSSCPWWCCGRQRLCLAVQVGSAWWVGSWSAVSGFPSGWSLIQERPPRSRRVRVRVRVTAT